MVKRFLAGAQCPACGQMDKLVVFREQEQDHVECVRCGYHQVEGGELVSPPKPVSPVQTIKFFKKTKAEPN